MGFPRDGELAVRNIFALLVKDFAQHLLVAAIPPSTVVGGHLRGPFIDKLGGTVAMPSEDNARVYLFDRVIQGNLNGLVGPSPKPSPRVSRQSNVHVYPKEIKT